MAANAGGVVARAPAGYVMHPMPDPLAPEALRAYCAPESLPFESTEELEPIPEAVGQDRASDALAFGLGVRRKGYNVFVTGRAGVGRHALVRAHVAPLAAAAPRPPDLAYACDLRDARRPRLVRVPAGTLAALVADFDAAVAEAAASLASARERAAGRALEAAPVRAAVMPPFEALRERHGGIPAVRARLEAIEEDVRERLPGLLRVPRADVMGADALASVSGPLPLDRYRLEPFVDHARTEGAPVVFVDEPGEEALFGAIDVRPTPGGPVTDFRSVRAGAIHRANGGYLVVDAHALVHDHGAYERLKRVLRAGEARIESDLSLGLAPEPVPLDLKVVLVGERPLYYLLRDADPELDEHFKVLADFDDDAERSPANLLAYARRLRSVIAREELPPFSRTAIARVVEEASRWADDAERISLDVRRASDLLVESAHLAGLAGEARVRGEDVEKALAGRERRHDRLRRNALRFIEQGVHRVDTEGRRVGQINGLGVESYGTEEMGVPIRITARVRAGRGTVVDIEREVDLSGPLHSKGVLILGGFLGGRYATGRPLSLHASLVMEQSYGSIDGDSASLAELCALLSALSEIPFRQDLGVTGSVDQLGQVQAVGGVNAKIEGFFDVCSARGPLAGHGVIVPASCVRHLMLRREIVDAARDGRFQVYAVETVNDALAILAGITPGERNAYGRFPEESVNARVEARLLALAATELSPHDA